MCDDLFLVEQMLHKCFNLMCAWEVYCKTQCVRFVHEQSKGSLQKGRIVVVTKADTSSRPSGLSRNAISNNIVKVEEIASKELS